MAKPVRDQLREKWAAILKGERKDDYHNPALSHFGMDLSWVTEETALKVKKT